MKDGYRMLVYAGLDKRATAGHSLACQVVLYSWGRSNGF